MRLIQYLEAGQIRVGVAIDEQSVEETEASNGVYGLALEAIGAHLTLIELVGRFRTGRKIAYEDLVISKKLLPPITHPDPAHFLLSGTGLTHLGSASAREAMHLSGEKAETLTDSMKMFRLGLEGGKPTADKIGAQPEWFYKGDGHSVVGPEQEFYLPGFVQDVGEEPEIVGIYLIGPDQQPYRVGFAVGNESSDHITERFNYLWLAHSKLRPSSFGPELLLGDLPVHLEGISRIWRDGAVLWEKPFLTGESNMNYSIATLEHHHFKYPQFREPGSLHIHFFGTATLSFADGIQTQAGDMFEIHIPEFGRPLRNTVRFSPAAGLIRIIPL